MKKKKICNSKNRKQLSHHRTACVVGKTKAKRSHDHRE
jgi:hypothetical protein